MSSWEESGKHGESEIHMQESMDPNRLTHLNRDELIVHCNNEVAKLKRNYESQVLHLIEEKFSLRREFLRGRGSSLPSEKTLDFDMLRRRIWEVISELSEVVLEMEEVAETGNSDESLSSSKGGLEPLVSENHHLRELLADKKKEVECLSLQVSEVQANLSERSLTEAKLLKTTVDLKSAVEDAHIEAFIVEDTFACILRGIVEQTSMQELCLPIIFTETMKDAEQKFYDLNLKYIDEKKHRVFLEMEKVETERKLDVEVATLQKKIHSLEEEKEQLEKDAAATLEKEKERYESALNNLREETCRQVKSVVESSAMWHKLFLSSLIERHETDICKLDEKLKLAVKELREVNEEKRMLLDVNREKQNGLSFLEAKVKELNEQLESTFTDFEHRVTQDITEKCLRLKSSNSQLHFLKQKANVIVRRGLLYQQRFEKRCSDLEKAEAEVDLLGGEVDTLLSLVEKIYIGLDHYSPILKHYPGVIEVLKLIKRELITWRKTKAACVGTIGCGLGTQGGSEVA